MSSFQKSDGMNYAPVGAKKAVCEAGEFRFSAVGLDHGHIFGMCNGLIEAGGELVSVYDPDEKKVCAFIEKYPQAKGAASYEEILADDKIRLVATAAIPENRTGIALRAMRAGKDAFCDKPPVVNREQLAEARRTAEETSRKFMAYFSERLHVEASVAAGELIEQGAIGKVVHMEGLGPHRLDKKIRPDWFFSNKSCGGILCDIGSHQIEQFLHYAGAESAEVNMSRVGNYNNPDYPNFQDFGDVMVTADNGVTGYFRLDWFTPDALPVWGDGRFFIVGTEGYIEIRKYVNLADKNTTDHLLLCNKTQCTHIELAGEKGFPFFGRLIRDCIDRTETAMTQEHVFKVMEISLAAQERAVKIR